MGMNWTDLRFLIDRSAGLFRRGLASLRTRGLRGSWLRAQKHLRPVPASQRCALYLPERVPFAPFALATTAAAGITPKASIVIPVFNQFAHTLACLRARRMHRSK